MKRKVPAVPNPVLHFGSDVARNLVKEIQEHFRDAFKALTGYHKKINQGMLKAMQNRSQADEVRKWLLDNCSKDQIQLVASLVRRYCLIADNDWRKTAFLSEEKNFWQASARTHTPHPADNHFQDLIHQIVVCCVKTGRDNQTCFAAIEEYRAQYEQEHQ
jgi:hypothetical protein